MPSDGERLTRRQEQAVAALLAHATLAAAAQAAGCSERTLKNWLKQPAFQAAYRQARQEVLERTVALLLTLSESAVLALGRNLMCKKPAAEIRAAEIILDRALKGVETLDLAKRIEALERDRA